MSMLSVFIVSLGLSMDNLAVSIAAGCANRNTLHLSKMVLVSSIFALAHIIMLSIGWFGGVELGGAVDAYDHWIAFGLLLFIGIKMIEEVVRADQSSEPVEKLTWKHIWVLAVATSLDALGVGVALSFIQASFWLTLGSMALCVWATSLLGFQTGGLLGRRFGHYMEVLGGVALCGIGIKILLSGLGIW